MRNDFAVDGIAVLEIDFFFCVPLFHFQERNYNIYLNHTSLLKAILLHSGIPEDKLNQASNILCDAMVSNSLTCITDVVHMGCLWQVIRLRLLNLVNPVLNLSLE